MEFGVRAPWYDDPVENTAFNLYAMNISRLNDIASEIVDTYSGKTITDEEIRNMYSLEDDELKYVINRIKDSIEQVSS